MRTMRSCPRLCVSLLLALATAAGACCLLGLTPEASHGQRAGRDLAFAEARDPESPDRMRGRPHDERSVEFMTDRRIATGTRPASVAAGHFDSDRLLDLVTANYEVDSISVLVQSRDGTFSRRDLWVGDGPRYVAAGDVTDDGLDDLAVVLAGQDAVALLVADGNGGFVVEGRYAVGLAPTSAVLSDLDQDGDLDLACSNGGDSTVTLLRNTRRKRGGGGPALVAWSTHVVGAQPGHVVTGDFNGDGLTDLATADPGHYDAHNSTVSVLPGVAGGGFASRIQSQAGRYPYALAAIDFDEDGDLDLAIAVDMGFLLLANDGAGRMTPGEFIEKPWAHCPSLVAADLDGDGRAELLLVTIHGVGYPTTPTSAVVVYRNARGSYLEEVAVRVGSESTQLIVCDLDGDGRPDAVTANRDSERSPGDGSSISVLRNRGDGRLAGVERRYVPGLNDDERWGGRIRALERPGHSRPHPPDLLLVTRQDARLMRNAGGGVFESPVVVIPHPIGATLDLTGDGVTDAIGHLDAGVERVFIGDQDGGFEPSHDFDPGGPYMFVMLDADALPDILLLSNPVRALDNLGRGRFGPPREPPGSELLAGEIRRWAVDLDDDGRDEICLVRTPYGRADTLVVVERDVDGGFRPGPEVQLPSDFAHLSPWEIAACPNTADGGVDVALLFGCGDCDASGLLMLRRQPNGQLERTDVLSGVGLEHLSLHFADLDGDGRGDVVISAGAGNASDEGSVKVFRNAGQGKLRREQVINTHLRIVSSVLTDLDADRRLDLAAYSSHRADLLILSGGGAEPARRVKPRDDRRGRTLGGVTRPGLPLAKTAEALDESGRLGFSLQTSGPAALALYDISGRRVISRDLGWLAAGEHVIELPELGTLRAGIYWVRVGERGAGEVRKIVVMNPGGGR